MAKYVSGRVKDLKVGITSYSEALTSLTVVGKIALGGQTIGGGNTAFTVDGNVGVGTDIPSDPVGAGNTRVIAVGIVSAHKLYGDGSNLSGIDATALKDAGGNVKIQANPSGAVVTGILTGADLDVDGKTDLDDVSVAGVATFAALVDANAGLDVTGHSELDNVNVSGVITAASYVGDGSLLTGVTSGKFAENSTGINTSTNVGIGTTTASSAITVSGDALITGVVTATTYNGDLVIGTPNGGFKSGAFTINNTDKTKDSINDLNNILGKLVPSAPTTINGVSISLTGTAGNGRLCAGFTPTNNTGGSAPVAGTQYTRNTDSTVSTNYITEYGPGDSGTVTGFVNAVGVGTTTLATGDNSGTSGAIQIANNEDASNSTRNPGIAAGFYEIYDLRMINGASPDGYNLAKFTQGGSTTGSVYWYEDPSTVAAPVISFSSVTTPSSPTLSYSSGIPHYTEAAANAFTYVLTVTNASGDMYTSNSFVNSDGQTSAMQNPGNKSYTNFAGGTNPPARNYGVGTGVTCLISQQPRNLHNTVTTNIFTSFDASTPYGSHNNQRVGYTTDFNIMGTSAVTSSMDEDNILVSSLGTGSGNATRVKAGATGDNPTPAYTAWTGGSVGSIDTYEAAVRGGVLYHDQTNYTTYLPAGPDYSSGRTGTQYFQIAFIRSTVSEFRITYAGSVAGCFVCMPDNSAWTTSLSGTNGWADMFQAYRGAGIPTGGEPGCATGGVMDTNGGTFTCTFGTESSSNDSNNRILIRWKLTSGQSITSMSFTST